MVKVYIDNKQIEVEEGTTIFQAAECAGVSIPHLCYHPAFKPEGSCRMCIIEIEGNPKLEPACSTIVREGMKISTHSEKVMEARKGVLEFLLAEHPPDCPICDQAGDCKLQDYYEEYGLLENRFDEYKQRKDKKVKIGKNLILDKERCILCTRCIRFLDEITKTGELGVFERGSHSEISIYGDAVVNNNYSGNLAEICPVGAITDSDFRFQTRNWFLEKKESICPFCSRGCNITIEYNSSFHRFPVKKRVFRINARENNDINKFWICDIGRYNYSYIENDRIDQISLKKAGNHEHITFEESIEFISNKIKKIYYRNKTLYISVVAHTALTNEELFLISKIFTEDLKVENIFFTDPPDQEGDDLLLTSERTPNKRGAKEIGLDVKPLELTNFPQKTELLIVFGNFLFDNFNKSQITDAFNNINTKILLTSSFNELNSFFDLVFPTAVIPEKEGSLTNIDGIVQKFDPALDGRGACRSEREILVEIAKKLNINFKYYKQFTSSDDIYEEMKNKIKFFRETK